MVKKKHACASLSGTTVLGERGQLVIPKEAREALKLKAGDTFLVMVHNESLVLLPKTKMQAFIKDLTSKLSI